MAYGLPISIYIQIKGMQGLVILKIFDKDGKIFDKRCNNL